MASCLISYALGSLVQPWHLRCQFSLKGNVCGLKVCCFSSSQVSYFSCTTACASPTKSSQDLLYLATPTSTPNTHSCVMQCDCVYHFPDPHPTFVMSDCGVHCLNLQISAVVFGNVCNPIFQSIRTPPPTHPTYSPPGGIDESGWVCACGRGASTSQESHCIEAHSPRHGWP